MANLSLADLVALVAVMDNWLTIIKTVAPWIGTAIAGPAGPLVGMAVSAAAEALGVKDKTVEAVKNAFSGATPEQLQAFKKADQDFAIRMQELGFKQVTDLEAIAAADRDSARKMQMSTQSFVPALLTCFVVAAFTVTLLLLLRYDVPGTNRDIVVYMIGQLSGGFAGALAFWLGTTRASDEKTKLLAQAAPVKT